MKQKIFTLLALVGALMLFACGKESPLSPTSNDPDTRPEKGQTVTLDKAQRTEFTGRAILSVIDQGTQFVDEKGALNVQDQVLRGRLLIDGADRDRAIRFITKYKIYPKGRGHGSGTVTLITEEGTWEGHHRIRFDDNVASGDIKCRLGNKKIKMRFHEVETDTDFRIFAIEGLLKEYQ